ncbi:hypothetical protein A2223_04160 [Candidatus Falkowbacteria bacterium RIFOXYA2_FULL_35_8]|uniref:Uncharacterized protein n=1 Tax=Candidatus Falkowbacteria bacterium RIFOXYC2_FULL_36_12 TaxID=1798002 RepID=A0A1F5SYD7_9BACT|nr:MAG: hypothetical protein A2478_04535 [Candidatus Falkowbacteria bacterium RIFOXYC2_FULL_36_12]OGF33652.1 MAG: hypothetical protein A2223_04160 [Candidatus Falkowbacteria bacterium RIFOXYA2_FULL_35_8]
MAFPDTLELAHLDLSCNPYCSLGIDEFSDIQLADDNKQDDDNLSQISTGNIQKNNTLLWFSFFFPLLFLEDVDNIAFPA